MNKFSLQKHVILLTGAAGYLGAGIAKALSDAGAVVILAGRTKDKLDALKGELNASGGKADSIVFDIGNNESHKAIVDWINENHGRLDGIVNNAYSGRVGVIENISADDFSLACAQNMTGPFNLIKESLELLQKTSEKNKYATSIVNIASMYGKVSPDPRIYGDSGQNNPIHYGATKAAMIQMTRYLACHLAERNIRVNSISPGAFPRPEVKESAPGFLAQLENKVPMGRIGLSEELAGPVQFLLSPASSYVTGIDLSVDGGWTAW